MNREQKRESVYSRLNRFVLACGSIHNEKDFTTGIVSYLGDILQFDKARIYYLNENGTIVDQYLDRTKQSDVAAYFDYYSTLSDDYDIRKTARSWQEAQMYRENFTVPVRNWSDARRDSFVCDYVRPLGIRHSLGFVLYDSDGSPRALFMIDKCSSPAFNYDGLAVLALALPHLNNLHKNFFRPHGSGVPLQTVRREDTGLTERELEIAALLCHDITPANISAKLHVTRATVYKHTHHIYEKLHVTNRQELMVKLMDIK